MASTQKAIIGAIFFLVAASASAQVYKWTDSNGVVHYGDRPPGGSARELKVAPPTGKADPGAAKAQTKAQQDSQDKPKSASDTPASKAPPAVAKLGEKECKEKLTQYNDEYNPETITTMVRDGKKTVAQIKEEVRVKGGALVQQCGDYVQDPSYLPPAQPR